MQRVCPPSFPPSSLFFNPLTFRHADGLSSISISPPNAPAPSSTLETTCSTAELLSSNTLPPKPFDEVKLVPKPPSLLAVGGERGCEVDGVDRVVDEEEGKVVEEEGMAAEGKGRIGTMETLGLMLGERRGRIMRTTMVAERRRWRRRREGSSDSGLRVRLRGGGEERTGVRETEGAEGGEEEERDPRMGLGLSLERHSLVHKGLVRLLWRVREGKSRLVEGMWLGSFVCVATLQV